MATVLDDIHNGMRVYDAAGTEIGTVEYVHFGDEDPSTPEVESPTVSPAVRRDPGLIDGIVDFFRGDDVPEPLRAQLLRNGFIRIDSRGLFAADRYVMPDQIASVSSDRVTLSVGKDELARRGG